MWSFEGSDTATSLWLEFEVTSSAESAWLVPVDTLELPVAALLDDSSGIIGSLLNHFPTSSGNIL